MEKTALTTRRRNHEAKGQLLLFPGPPATLPDLARLFDDLNGRFFGGHLRARVEWSERLTACAGTCRTPSGLIRISAPYYRRRPETLPWTLAHEMCHLVVPGHGPEYRALGRPIAERFGITWRQFRYCEKWADLARYRYLYRCPVCGSELASSKRRSVSCGSCGPGRYDGRFHMKLAESRARPGPVLLGERPVRCG